MGCIIYLLSYAIYTENVIRVALTSKNSVRLTMMKIQYYYLQSYIMIYVLKKI